MGESQKKKRKRIKGCEKMKYKVQEIMSYYENYKVKVGGKWYFVTRKKIEDAVKRGGVSGTIVKKRTRTWIE